MRRAVKVGFTRPVRTVGLAEGGEHFRIEAVEEEREALARYLSVPVVERLIATVSLVPKGKGGLVALKADLQADIVQTCVITIEPFTSHIESSFERLYSADVEDEWSDLAAQDTMGWAARRWHHRR